MSRLEKLANDDTAVSRGGPAGINDVGPFIAPHLASTVRPSPTAPPAAWARQRRGGTAAHGPCCATAARQRPALTAGWAGGALGAGRRASCGDPTRAGRGRAAGARGRGRSAPRGPRAGPGVAAAGEVKGGRPPTVGGATGAGSTGAGTVRGVEGRLCGSGARPLKHSMYTHRNRPRRARRAPPAGARGSAPAAEGDGKEDEGKGDDDRVVEREEGGQRVRAPHRRLALRRDVPLRPRAAVIACGTGLAAWGMGVKGRALLGGTRGRTWSWASSRSPPSRARLDACLAAAICSMRSRRASHSP
jgi:hypothetical protein